MRRQLMATLTALGVGGLTVGVAFAVSMQWAFEKDFSRKQFDNLFELSARWSIPAGILSGAAGYAGALATAASVTAKSPRDKLTEEQQQYLNLLDKAKEQNIEVLSLLKTATGEE